LKQKKKQRERDVDCQLKRKSLYATSISSQWETRLLFSVLFPFYFFLLSLRFLRLDWASIDRTVVKLFQ